MPDDPSDPVQSECFLVGDPLAFNVVSMQACFHEFRRRRSAQFIVGLCLLHLIPIWGFTFVPTQDGLSHLYNAYILKEWKNPEYTKFHEVYSLNLTLFPNWSTHAFFFIALHVFPPLIVEKLFLTICVLLYPLSFNFLLSAIDRRLRIFGLLGFLYSYNYLLQLGFYNFALSVPLCLIAIGYWWKHRGDFQIAHAAVLNLLLIATYFSHLGSYTLLVFALSSLALFDFLKHLFQWREGLQKLLQFVGYLLPAYFVLLNSFLANFESNESVYKSGEFLWDYFINVKSLVYFNDSYLPISWILLGVVCFCIAWTLIERVCEKRIFESRDGFLFIAIVLTVLYFRLPWQYGPPAWINDRIHLYIFPILLGWFAVPRYVWVKHGLTATMLLISMWHLGLTIRDYHLLNKDMREFMSGTHLIEPNSTISNLRVTDYHGSEHHGPVKYVAPMLGGVSFYCLGNGCLYDGNYEPKYDYFPLQYKDGHWKFKYLGGPVDYWLAWYVDAQHEEVKALAEDYQLIHETKNLKLFRRRSKPTRGRMGNQTNGGFKKLPCGSCPTDLGNAFPMPP